MQTLMHILKFLWRGLGKPGAVLVLMGVVTITDAIAPGTVGHFWFGLLLLTFYCSSIAEKLDKFYKNCRTNRSSDMQSLPHINDLRRNGYDPTECDADDYIYPTTQTGVTTMSQRPDLFTHTVNTLQYGSIAIELSEKLHECVQATKKTGKKATLVFSLVVKPVGHDTGQYEFSEDINCKLPKPSRGITLMFETPDGNFTRNDPRQGELQLRSADEKKPITEALKTA